MKLPCSKSIFAILFVAGSLLTGDSIVNGQVHASSIGKTGLPLPRFVSIKSQRVNMRVGPGKQYKVDWLYQKKGLPLEIIQEYDNWRKVRDPDGNEGWILHSLLSGARTAVVAPWKAGERSETVNLYASSKTGAAVVAYMEPGVIAQIRSCDSETCKIQIEDIEGYISKNTLWGVYPDEKIED